METKIKKEEAIKRMETLHLLPRIVKEFKEGTLNASEGPGILFWLTEEEKKLVSEFEENWSAVVYHVIRSQTIEGERHLTFLCVSNYESDWEQERKELQTLSPIRLKQSSSPVNAHETCAYVANLKYPCFSEFGYVAILPVNGGIVRLA